MSFSVIKKSEDLIPKKGVISAQVLNRIPACLFIVLIFNLYFLPFAVSQDKDDLSISSQTENIKLKQAAMCEEIRDNTPYNQGVVFSSSLGNILCFTEFDPVLEKTAIYHKYYFIDKLSSKKKLILNPPRWATYSSIQPRETDKGPWRVEIVDTEDNILYILRFSITD